MTIKSVDKLSDCNIEIDLTGPQGNAYFLMAQVGKFCKRLGKDSEPILKDMNSGDYEHLLEVFEREFGDFVTLYR